MSTKTRLLIALMLGVAMALGCSEQQKEQAQEGAQEAAETTASATANTAMTGKITAALQNANALKMEDMDVDTTGKTITIRGYVESQEMKDTAERVAKDTAGPEYTIVNDIAITKAPS